MAKTMICRICHLEKPMKDFIKDDDNKRIDVCKECDDEAKMSDEEKEGWNDILDNLNK
jgi:protein-arginine kinase activator protein McsA